MSSSSSNLLSLAGWAFLPGLVTGWLQSLYYSIAIRAGDPKPAANTARYQLHRRRIHTAVILVYLAYTIYEAEHMIRSTPNFYAALSVPPEATDREIKSRFRRLAAIHHPDKLAPPSASASGLAAASGEEYFLYLKLAQDTLLNPARRFAYERFGLGALEWPRCASIRDFLTQGVQGVLPYYGAAALGLYVIGLLGYLRYGKPWRWLTLACMCVLELHVISRPYFPVVATRLINPLRSTLAGAPPYLPFELVTLARKLVVTLFIALNQLGPLYESAVSRGSSGGSGSGSGASDHAARRAQLDRLDAATKMADAEARRLLSMEMAPYVGGGTGTSGSANDDDAQTLAVVRHRVRDWLVQNTIRNDVKVRDSMGRLLRKGREVPGRGRGRGGG